jgi:hypothetical protein
VSAPATDVGAHAHLTRAVVVSSYVILGAILVWSRLYGLGNGGYCCDEIATVTDSVRRGPSWIVSGTYSPNNHQLFSLFGWAASSLVGESEVLLRLGAAVPFVAGIVLVTAWLHVRYGAFCGLLFLFLATASPLLLDLARQSRGYGIAFLAMSVVVVAALEALRSDRTWAIVALCVGGVVGAWTLPHFTVAFLAIGAVLLAVGVARSKLAVGLGVSIAAIAVWYAPHIDDIFDSSRDDYAVELSSRWIVTAAIDQTLVPAFSLLSDDYLHPNLASLALVVLFAIVLAASPLLHTWTTALTLAAPVVATILTFWVTSTHAAPRFFSFLLVPLFVLAATGAAAALGRLPRRPTIPAAAALVMLLVVAVASVPWLVAIPREPREALDKVADAIDELPSPATPVFAYVSHPGDLEFHLGRRVADTRTSAEILRACSQAETTVLVMQIWLLDAMAMPCPEREGIRHTRFDQYARGEAIDMWVIPPSGGTS